MLAAAAFLFLAAGCGDDDGGVKPVQEVPAPTSPENVLLIMAAAYNEMDYERYWPLIHDQFTFVFNEEDMAHYPDDIPPSGVWGKSAELQAHEHLLDPNYVPEGNPGMAVRSMTLAVEIYGEIQPTHLAGAPEGTVEADVTFDLRVSTVDEINYLVNSKPLFYFVPITGQSEVRWYIWYIADGIPSTKKEQAISGNDGVGAASASATGKYRSWGGIKAQYLGN
jgi:hypothetical protein